MPPPGRAAIDVLVLTDGVAGHDRASDGILAALARLGPVRDRWLGVAEHRPASRRIARVAAAFMPPAPYLARNVCLSPDRVAAALEGRAVAGWPDRADVVVSTGPATAAMNVAAARRYGASNVYYGFPKVPHLGFTLLLSPVPSRCSGVVLAPRPSRIDAADLPPPRPVSTDGARTLALLVGGDTKHYRYSADDMAVLGHAVVGLLGRHPGWSLAVYDSRRTSAAPFGAFVAATEPLRPRVALHLFARGGAFSNASAYGADFIIVTADSLSMISEAIAAGRPTLVVRPAAYAAPARDRDELRTLARENLVATATLGEIGEDVIAATPRPPATSQIASLAGLLAARGF